MLNWLFGRVQEEPQILYEHSLFGSQEKLYEDWDFRKWQVYESPMMEVCKQKASWGNANARYHFQVYTSQEGAYLVETHYEAYCGNDEFASPEIVAYDRLIEVSPSKEQN